ncbi:MAG: hypothetical protein JWN70_2572 [Planctomycetaceae bacterium]|nr:hypothetical protein [Planctomycetaceae bacterium]
MASQILALHESHQSPASPRFAWMAASQDVLAIASKLPLWCAVLPLAGFGLIGLLGSGQFLSWFVGKYAWTGKDFQEILGPSLLAAALVLAIYLWLVERHVCRAWVICLPAILLCRELHFAWTGAGVYVGLVVLAVSAVRNQKELSPVWSCSSLCGWWLGAVSWYVLAVSVDSGVWKVLPHARLWGVNLEETMESGGHLFVLLGVLCSVVMVIGKRRVPMALQRYLSA